MAFNKTPALGRAFFIVRSGVRVAQFKGAALAAQLAVEVFQRVVELGGGTVDCLVHRSGSVGHGNRLVAFGASSIWQRLSCGPGLAPFSSRR